MEPLTIEPTFRVALSETPHIRIMLVGVGGTGSTLAQFLAGLIHHARQKNIIVDMTLVDHDLVEWKNCGRQALSLQAAANGRIPKAADVALRLGAAYGIAIQSWARPYTAKMGDSWLTAAPPGRSAPLIIGCVDNHLARREIAETVHNQRGRLWAIDCGNDRYNGQVLIGNTANPDHIALDKLRLCNALPSPYIQEPDLLKPDPADNALSCAEMAETETQSLMVNRMAATIAAHFAAEFILRREITAMGAYFNLKPPTVVSRLITQTNLAQCQRPSDEKNT